MTHTYVSKRHRTIIETIFGLFLIEPSFSEIWIKLLSIKNINLKIPSANCRSFCLGLNVLGGCKYSQTGNYTGSRLAVRVLPAKHLRSKALTSRVPWKRARFSFIFCRSHYSDVIMGAMACKIPSLTIVYSIVYSGADQRKYQCSTSLAFVRGIHRGPVNSPHKRPVTRKLFPFVDVIKIPKSKLHMGTIGYVCLESIIVIIALAWNTFETSGIEKIKVKWGNLNKIHHCLFFQTLTFINIYKSQHCFLYFHVCHKWHKTAIMCKLRVVFDIRE